jgi:uroporphyrinogen-III synthase
VLAFEARRAAELARMLERHGATVMSAPALREAALPASDATRAVADALASGTVAALVLLTGVGTRALARLLTDDGHDPVALFQRAPIVARGPKPVAALRELGITDPIQVPTPNTWREVLTTMHAMDLPDGSLIAIQEYGASPHDLLEGLHARGHRTLTVPVYRWALPTDLAPLKAGLAALQADTIDVAVFTSATQIEHAFRITEDATSLRNAFSKVVIASVGPVCTEALEAHGLNVDLEATPPKLGPLVATIADHAPTLIPTKRR